MTGTGSASQRGRPLSSGSFYNANKTGCWRCLPALAHIFQEGFEPERTGNAERQGFHLYFPYKVVYEMFVVSVGFMFLYKKNVLSRIFNQF